MPAARIPPAERVRARLRAVAGDAVAAVMPAGYQRLGQVLLVRLPAELEAYRPLLGDAWREELGVSTVLARRGPVTGEYRRPLVERLSGDVTETEVIEHGTHWRLDAARLMFAAGNRTERLRFARLVRAGEVVADLFAGIGYFTIPAARAQPAARFVAVEKNPLAFRYLEENLRRNRVADRVSPVFGDNRTVALPPHGFDRLVLGYLPSALPWLGRAVDLVAPSGGMIHLHLVTDARSAVPDARRLVWERLRELGAEATGPLRAREVKPYGPGRTHVVVDAPVCPPA